jgi:hypothetical protein
MNEVISNFEDFEKLKNSIIEKAIVDESWEFPNSQELTKKMVNEIGSSLEGNEKLKRFAWNCVMELLQMSNRFFVDNGNFKTHFTFSIIDKIPHLFMAYNRHESSTIMRWTKFIDEHNESDKKVLKNIFRDIVKSNSKKYSDISLSIIDLLRKSGNPIYYQLIPQKERNPIIEFIVWVSV